MRPAAGSAGSSGVPAAGSPLAAAGSPLVTAGSPRVAVGSSRAAAGSPPLAPAESSLAAAGSSLAPAPPPLPRHIAIIMDGNRRWAKARRLPSIEGHRRGIVALREITRAASDLAIPMLTVYGFSTENWKRDSTEISLLLDLCVYFCRSELAELHRNNVNVRVIGQYQMLPRASREALDELMAKTAANTGLALNLAVNYSARAELRIALAAIARDVTAGSLDPAAIDEAAIASYLSTASMPDPDLLIRPGGESRLSNFLLYQLADAELYLTDVLWPDFNRAQFQHALEAYRTRTTADADGRL